MAESGKTSLAVLGSTGSIGRSTLAVLDRLTDRFDVRALAGGRNVDLLAEQVRTWNPRCVSVAGRAEADLLRGRLPNGWRGELDWGEEPLGRMAADPETDIVVNGLVGGIGLIPTVKALEAGHRVALANKESLVMAGRLLAELAERTGGEIIPVDSEHSGLFQLLVDRDRNTVSRVVLTASGGPFRSLSLDELRRVTPRQALAHPTWNMGPRITIDSATLLNKGLEVLEAQTLFDLPLDEIEVWIHPQSIVHALVELVDGSLLAQLSQPDMRIPIQLALTYPDRAGNGAARCRLPELGRLDFEAPDEERFPCLPLAREAARRGGLAPAVLNAGDEIAVAAFLRGDIPFTQIPLLLARLLDACPRGAADSVEEILEADRWARERAESIASSLR